MSCTIIAREVGAIQQLILMALSDNEIVVQQACKILGTCLHSWWKLAQGLQPESRSVSRYFSRTAASR